MDKSLIYNRFGLLEEMKENFSQAIIYYKRAIKLCLIDDKMEDMKKNIARCEYKLQME
jgi:hypothetical protein